MSDYVIANGELQHAGIKGMKWGVRRYQNKDGSLTPEGKKRYGNASETNNKNYSDKQRKNDRAFYGTRGEKRINKKLNEGYGLRGARHFEVERKTRAEKTKKIATKVTKKSLKLAKKVGMTYVADQMFNEGRGTRLVKEVAKQTGRAFVTAFVMARGGYDIRWYDN